MSPRAGRDLTEIGEWIAVDSPRAARKVTQALRALCFGLARAPARFPIDAETGLHRAPHGAYLIFYRIKPEEVQIVRILHGARDHAAALRPDMS